MLLEDIREFLKTKTDSPQWYLNKAGEKEKCITIYNSKGLTPNVAIGGKSSYTTKAISILIRWGKVTQDTEEKAQEVYDAFFMQEGTISNKRIVQFDMKTTEPVYIGTDENGNHEYVIDLIIYYER